jgi:hypothetical protein
MLYNWDDTPEDPTNILHRNCRLKYITEGKREGTIEVRGRRGRRLGQLPDDLDGRRGSWKLKWDALDGTVWRNRFGRGCGPVIRQTAE